MVMRNVRLKTPTRASFCLVGTRLRTANVNGIAVTDECEHAPPKCKPEAGPRTRYVGDQISRELVLDSFIFAPGG